MFRFFILNWLRSFVWGPLLCTIDDLMQPSRWFPWFLRENSYQIFQSILQLLGGWWTNKSPFAFFPHLLLLILVIFTYQQKPNTKIQNSQSRERIIWIIERETIGVFKCHIYSLKSIGAANLTPQISPLCDTTFLSTLGLVGWLNQHISICPLPNPQPTIFQRILFTLIVFKLGL